MERRGARPALVASRSSPRRNGPRRPARANARRIGGKGAASVLALAIAGCAADEPVSATSPVAFRNYCAACHHPEGLGIPGGPPPLVDSPWVRGPESRLVRIVLHGVGGRLRVGDAVYELEMPAFGPVLTDAQIAETLSFVRVRFAEPDAEPVREETVARIRAETADRDVYWSAEELLAIP